MRLSRLRLTSFRNLADQELSIPAEGVVVVGDNAQGKSNFLESVYYLETLRSFRGARDSQLVGFGAELFRVDATVGGEDPTDRRTLGVGYSAATGEKRVTVDGARADRLVDAIGCLGAVIFSPSDTSLVGGPPAERRRFLDVVLSLNRPGYVNSLQRFRHALAQRNAALRSGAPDAAVRAWDEPLVGPGSDVIAEREAWVERWGADFDGLCDTVADGVGGRMTYRPSVRSDGGAAADAYREALLASVERERRMGTTVVGPHRDDLHLTVGSADDEVDVRDFGSGGQKRTAALALRLVEARTVREARGAEPLVLIDDAFAELDDGRATRVLELLQSERTGQVILTAPREADLRVRGSELPRWRVKDGRIEC